MANNNNTTSPDFSGAGPLGQLLQQIVNMIGGTKFGAPSPIQQNAMNGIQQMFTNPLGSGIFQGLVGSVLNALKPSEAAAQQNLTDQFRMAGGGQASPLQSGAFAKQQQLLQGNILGQESSTIANLAQNSMSQLMQALGLGFNMGAPQAAGPQQMIADLLNALGHGVDLSGAQARAQAVANSGGGGGGTASTPTGASQLSQLLQSLGGASASPYYVPGVAGTQAQIPIGPEQWQSGSGQTFTQPGSLDAYQNPSPYPAGVNYPPGYNPYNDYNTGPYFDPNAGDFGGF